MKKALLIEDVREGFAPDMWHKRQMAHPESRGATLKSRSWVARLSWNGTLRREFMDGFNDYFRGNEKGTRGVYKCFFLEDGVYEVSAPVGFYDIDRYFCYVDEGELTRIDRQEVIRCLREG